MLVPHRRRRRPSCRASPRPPVDWSSSHPTSAGSWPRPDRSDGWPGRVRTGGWPSFPVNFTVDGRSVHIRTAAYSAAARECDDSPVAFEIDMFDEAERSGWSVLMRGHAHLDFGSRAGVDEPDVWPAGTRHLQLRDRGRGGHRPADPPCAG